MSNHVLPTLLEIARGLNEIERAHVACIMVTPAEGGYFLARFSVHLFLPHGAEPELPEGVKFSGIERYADIERLISWHTPAWEQVLAVVNDPELSKPESFGRMEAAEKAIVREGKPSDTEAGKHWVISTHGAPRSPERMEWIGRMMASPYSARL